MQLLFHLSQVALLREPSVSEELGVHSLEARESLSLWSLDAVLVVLFVLVVCCVVL